MFKTKNKFIYFVIFLIILLVSSIISYVFIFKKVDRSSYIVLIEWSAVLNSNPIAVNSKNKLEIWDIIKTTSEESLAIIEWWDGSITRMWWNSEIEIEKLFVSTNREKLEIAFELIDWKTWSNIVSFIWEDSYFKQSFWDSEAAVRWTVFNVDLVNDYIHVIDHQVSLINQDWEVFLIDENKPFNLKTFSFIALQDFIIKIKDKTFEKLNKDYDLVYLDSLKKYIQEDIESFIEIQLIENNKELYSKILAKYQEINFISPEDKELYKLKIWLKQKLVELAPEEQKEILLNSFVFELKDSFKSKNYDDLGTIIKTIWENKQFINIEEIFEILRTKNLSDEFKNFINNNLLSLQKLFWEWFNINSLSKSTIEWIKNISDELDNDIKWWLDNLKEHWDKADEEIKWWLDNLKEYWDIADEEIKLWLDNLKEYSDKADWQIKSWLDNLKDFLLGN